MTSKLTMSLGLRWDTWFPDYSLNPGQGGRYEVIENTVYIPGTGGVSQSANAQTQWTNFAPRFGLAYALANRTVIRAGYGCSYFQGTFGWTFNNLAAAAAATTMRFKFEPRSPWEAITPSIRTCLCVRT